MPPNSTPRTGAASGPPIPLPSLFLPAALLGLLLAGGLLGCRDDAARVPVDGEGDALPGDTVGVTPALYRTELAFVPARPDQDALLLLGVHETGPGLLARHYRGLLFTAGGLREPLTVRDSLPVPRAAWRLLPAPGLRLRVGDAGELVGLRLSTSSGPFRLTRGAPMEEWTGTTGQREALARARSGDADGAGEGDPGLLLVRRAARSRDAPPTRDVERVFLLADSAGHALVVVRASGRAAAASAWGWLPEARGHWTDVTVAAADSAAREGWRMRLPGPDLEGAIRLREPGAADAGHRVAAELRGTSGRPLRLHGLTWVSRLP